MEVACKCGYEGNQVVEFETVVPVKRTLEWYSGYWTAINSFREQKLGTYPKVLNWACPECGRILVQQRGGLSYNHKELEEMNRRLARRSWDNRKFLREMAKPIFEVKVREEDDPRLLRVYSISGPRQGTLPRLFCAHVPYAYIYKDVNELFVNYLGGLSHIRVGDVITQDEYGYLMDHLNRCETKLRDIKRGGKDASKYR